MRTPSALKALGFATLFGFSTITFASPRVSLASQAQVQPPKHQSVLGAATYVTMPLRGLTHPKLLWADTEYLAGQGISPDQILKKFAYASPVDGESAESYSNETKIGFVDGNGGIGMNGNFGSGRAATIVETRAGSASTGQDWQIKGSGRTPMVNKDSDQYHRNGASVLGEGIHEAIWGKLLALEMPYGAYRTVAVIATGSLGVHPKNKTEKFRAGIFEFIDRQAIQHGYAWAHSLFHGGTSPTNAGLDGRMLDFGTFSAFDGYPNARVIDEDGFFGDTELYKRDLLKDIRDSWVRTLSSDLLAVLPSEAEWFNRFEATFQTTRQREMLRLAGAFTEFTSELMARSEGQRLAKVLIKIAEAGNTKKIEIWEGQNPFGTGTYNLGKILALAAGESFVNGDVENSGLRKLIPEEGQRTEFVDAYVSFLKIERQLALHVGISPAAETRYRRLAVKMRNRKMTAVFRLNKNEKHIWKIEADFAANGDPKPVQSYIDNIISESRRDFHHVAPYSIVYTEANSKLKNAARVFDAVKNQFVTEPSTDVVRTIPVRASRLSEKTSAIRCEGLFLKAN